MIQDYFIVSVNHYVDKRTFVLALTSYYWTKMEGFPPKLSKKQAKEILKDSLRVYGFDGIDRTYWDGANDEFITPWDDAYQAATEWIEKNYKLLK